eukprot:TRINITY_DN24085_c0_g1_i5.p1 TRINITY_DN24085_c0_g1~~TRINITY_DN24085_c0_g1_i5.p1  ORF type:complete len:403 (+),score=53.33 TRINITY_DN24085_c0_g1_i5:1277-2485(+)
MWVGIDNTQKGPMGWGLLLCLVALSVGVYGGNDTLAPTGDRPHLDVRLYLPVGIDQLFNGFEAVAMETVSGVVGVPTADMEVALSANPPRCDLLIYVQVADMKKVSTLLKEAVNNGMHIKGVRITGADVYMVADSILDECESSPCGADQTCNDLNLRSLNDFVCICKDGSSTAVAAPANCTAPHLYTVFLLPTNPNDLLDGFVTALQNKISDITGLPLSVILDIALHENPNSASARIYTQEFNLKLFKTRIEDIVSKGMYVAGVLVTSVTVQMVGEGIQDECDAQPCGNGQTCKDPDVRTQGDFVCSCLDGSYPMVGGSTPSCTLGFSSLQHREGLRGVLRRDQRLPDGDGRRRPALHPQQVQHEKFRGVAGVRFLPSQPCLFPHPDRLRHPYPSAARRIPP